jgi:L-ascorbate metabolism protein UlaG (beta-lactamase superfamily)
MDLPRPGSPGPMPDGLFFVGNATTLIRYAGFTVLTDPNFLHRGQRAYLGKGMWSKRRTEPALQPADLPALDLVVLSHLHGDHFDRVARRGLVKSTPIATTPAAARRLRHWGFATRPLETWESTTLQRGDATLRLTALPGRHAPGAAAALFPPVMGSLLEITGGDRPPLRLYLSGDTLVHDDLKEIAERYDLPDLGVLHLGGTKRLGLLLTMDARQGVDLLELLRPRVAVPVHHDDYGIFTSSLSDFLDEVGRRTPPSRVVTVGRGETLPLPVPDDWAN